MHILVFNAGSSSLKCHLYDWTGIAEHDTPQSGIWQKSLDWPRNADHAAILAELFRALPVQPDAIGHRIVHGGDKFRDSVLLTHEVQQQVMAYSSFAPSHNPIQLAMVDEAENITEGKVPQVGVFDTAFHATLAPEEYVYAIPQEWLERGVRRYGFHGISHQYVSRQAAQLLGRPGRMITCHLGNGCSLAAISAGECRATTMGFTPLEGLVMGSRSGSIDPGILIHMMRHHGYTADMLDALLNKKSGMKGISGISGDMRQLLAAIDQGNEAAQLAFDVFTAHIAQNVAALIPAIGGLDALVFTAGIGENVPQVRAEVCRRLGFLGIELDRAKNESKPVDVEISTPQSKINVLTVKTEEDWEIARQCYALCKH